MSTRRTTCYVATCDGCRLDFDESGPQGVTLHFDTENDALGAAVADGWQITEAGLLLCRLCLARRLNPLCLERGHDYSDWTPCACQGRIPDHALFGCGLFRYCLRDHCDGHDAATLAALPTVDEPHRR